MNRRMRCLPAHVASAVLATLLATSAAASGHGAADAGRDLTALQADLVRHIEAALPGDTPGARPREVVLTLEGALVHHANAAQIDPSGVRREHAILSLFRLGDGWTRPSLRTVNGRFETKLSVHGIDASALAWDGERLTGTVVAEIGRINLHRDYGEGENMHSMLKAQRRAVMNWHMGGRHRVFPRPHTFTLDARLVPQRLVLELTFSAFAGDDRPGRMPAPDETTKMRPGEADAQLFPHPRNPLTVTLVREGDEWVGGEGHTPSWNRAIHTVDADGLAWEDGRLVGTLVVTLLPDPWVPGRGPDGTRVRRVTCKVAATIRDGAVRGRYEASGDQGAYEGTIAGKAWQSLLGTYTVDGADGRLTGPIDGRVRPAPGQIKAIGSLDVPPFESPVWPDATDDLWAAVDAYRRAHAALLTLAHLPVSGEASFGRALEMPAPLCAGATARTAYIEALARYVRTAAAEGPAPLVGHVAPDDGDFGPYLPPEPLAGDALPETVGQAGPQQWRVVSTWRAVGPIERQGRSRSWHPAHLPSVVPIEGVTYAVPRPKLAETLTIRRAWHEVRTRDEVLRPHPESWRDTFTQASGYTGYGSYPVNSMFYDRQNASRSHTWYAATTLRSSDARPLWLAVRAADWGRLWVNGRLVWDSGPDHEPASVSIFEVPLVKGANELLIESGKRSITFHHPSGFDRSGVTVWVATRGRPREGEALAKAREAERAAHARSPSAAHGYYAADGRHFPDAEPPMHWDVVEGENVVWRAPVGGSDGPPVVAGGRVFVTVEPHTLVCLDSETGAERWRRGANLFDDEAKAARFEDLPGVLGRLAALEREWNKARRDLRDAQKARAPDAAEVARLEASLEEIGGRRRTLEAAWQPLMDRLEATGVAVSSRSGLGRRATAAPVRVGDRVWVVYGTGVAACYTLDGEVVWERVTGLPWDGGIDHSPVVCGDRLVVVGTVAPREGENRRPYVLAAFDAASGDPAWQSDPLAPVGSTGDPGLAPVRLAGDPPDRYVFVTPDGTVVDGADGRILYRRQFDLPGPITPLVHENVAYLFARNLGQAALRFWVDAGGRVACRKLWQTRRGGTSSNQQTRAGIVLDGLIYVPRSCDENGGHAPINWDQLDVYEPELGQHLARPNPVIRTAFTPLPLVRAGDVLVQSDHGRAAHRSPPKAAVTFLRPGDTPCLLLPHVFEEGTLRAAPAFDGPRMILRIDGSVVAVGRGTPEARDADLRALAKYVLAEIGRRPHYGLLPLAPPEGFEPSLGMPVERLRPFIPPTRWLVAGPLPIPPEGVALWDANRADFVPRPGEVLAVGGERSPWRRLPADWRFMRGMTKVFRSSGTFYTPTYAIDVDKALAGRDGRMLAYATVLDVPEQAAMRFMMLGARAWIDGREVPSETPLLFEPGRHPMLVRIDAPRIPPVGRLTITPRFTPLQLPSAAEKEWLDRIRQRKDVLQRIVKALPESYLARRARERLEALAADETAGPAAR